MTHDVSTPAGVGMPAACNEFRNAKHRDDGKMPQISTDTFWQSNIAMENCHVE